MKCPRCNEKTYVNDSRERGGIVYRNRLCAKCGLSFFTYEVERLTIAKEAPKLMEFIRKEENNV